MNNNTTIGQLQLERISGVRFVVCGSCYWCASVFGSGAFAACPSCRNETLDFMSIAAGENYVFNYDEKRGMVIDFAPTKRK